MQRYTREAGVRNMERKIGAICRAVALKIAEKYESRSGDSIGNDGPLRELPILMDEHAVEDILGVSERRKQRLEEKGSKKG